NIACAVGQISGPNPHVSHPQEGRIAIVTDVGRGMRWTCWRARRARPARTAKSCGPDLPTLVSSSARRIVERWWLKSPVHQGEHVYAVKPLRRECRRFGVPVVTCLRAFSLARKAAGAFVAPAFPVPSYFRGTRSMQNPGAKLAAGMRMLVSFVIARDPSTLAPQASQGRSPAEAPQRVGGSEAIQTASADTLWIASSLRSLAMTTRLAV